MTNLSKQRELFDWLHSLDLSHHFDHFLENGYEDLDICREIGESDLQAIGVCDIHERISLLQAIRHSRQVQHSQSSFSTQASNTNTNTRDRDRDNYISANYNYQECDDEPFYESVLPFEHVHDYEFVPECSSGSCNGHVNVTARNSGIGRIIWPNSTHSQSADSRPHSHLQNSLHDNLIPRTQLRDRVRQDGINISRVRNIPDELTLGAIGIGTHTPAQYACELSSSQNTGEFLTFEEETNHQLREMWLEERRKLVSQPGFSSSMMLHGGSESQSQSPIRRLVTRETLTFNSNNCSSSSIRHRKSNVNVNVPSATLCGGYNGKFVSALHHPVPVPVPTVSGIVSSGSGIGNPPFERLVDSSAVGAFRSPDHRPPQHQYLQHVIISNENMNIGNVPLSSYSHPLAGGQYNSQEERPVYTPGIYLPSSCLLDKDEIYDYAPPRNYCSPSKRSLQSPFKSKGKSKAALSCYHGTAQTSPSRRQYATIRNGSNNKSMSRSVSLNVNHASPTYVNTSALVTGDLSKSSSSSHGCRTLTNLSKLSRRLGLSRFFRTFRTHGNGSNSSQNSKLMAMSTTTTNSKSSSSSNHQLVPSNAKNQEDGGTSSCTLSSLPSNERIIETINRLKYEELQKRKERIAQEHQLILKELKNSMSPSTNSSDGPSSIFYVSNSNSNGGTDEEAGVAKHMPDSVTLSSLEHQHQQHTYYDPPYENEHNLKVQIRESGSDHFNSKNKSQNRSNVDVNAIEEYGTAAYTSSEMGSKLSKKSSVVKIGSGIGVGIGNENDFQFTTLGKGQNEYGEPDIEVGVGTYHERGDDPASNRTSSSSNYHSNSMSESISSAGEVNGLGVEPENISHVNVDGAGRNRVYRKNPTCEILSSSNADSSTSTSTTSSTNPTSTSSRRGSQTEQRFSTSQHLQEQNQHQQHLRLSETQQQQQIQEERENSFSQTKSLFGKVKELGSKSRRRFSHKASSGSLHNSSGSNESSQPNSLNLNNFDEVRKSTGDGNGDGKEGLTTTTLNSEMNTYRSKAVDIIGTESGTAVAASNSSEEELASITNSQSGGFGSLSLSETEEYTGPFVGRAVALVDCMHSPYDRHALRYKKGDLIEIISKKPTGLWTGKVNGQVGHFKFINVEILPDVSDEEDLEDEASNAYERSGDNRNRQAHSYLHNRRRNKRMTEMTPWEMEQRQTVMNAINGIRKENAALSHHSKSLDSESPFKAVQSRTGRRKSSAAAASLKKGRPKSVGDLLRRINLEEYISVFILHGFESLDLFKELEEEDLDRLAIRNQSDRAKILTIVELLREFDSEAEIPPIIIPTYSCPSQLDEDDRDNEPEESGLHRIIAPPANFTRTAGAGTGTKSTMVRDSGVFVKCDDQEDPEIEEIILSPVNLRVDISPRRNYDASGPSNLNSSSIFLGRLTSSNSGNGKQFQSNSNHLSQLQHMENSDNGSGSAGPMKINDELWPEQVEQYCAVRQRFLQAKSLFESGITSPGGTPQGQESQNSNSQKNRFLFCEKSSDSGISVGANSPPPLRND